MSALKTQRGPVRSVFTKALNEILAELKKSEVDKTKVINAWKKLERHNLKIKELDKLIEDEMRSASVTEAEFQKEYEDVTHYQEQYDEVCHSLSIMWPATNDANVNVGETTKYKLPKLEFKNYGGDPKGWLGFWSQFKAIHEDPALPAEVKFQYLVQATTENSPAREVVESFPVTRENYKKVIEYMKDRFGKDEILVEYYVREMLRLVLSNLSGKESLPVAGIYDKLETHLRNLETLGVTSDKYAAMLYPLVESSLSEETLRAWERVKAQFVKKDKLTGLMSFLRAEVDSEIRIQMAQTGFDKKDEPKVIPNKKKSHPPTPTASDLFNGDDSNKRKSCIFCDKAGHDSVDCYTAPKMTYAEKRKAIGNAKACFRCLKRGHFSEKCRAKVNCQLCERKHVVLMCPDNPKNKVKEETPPENENNMSNQSSGKIMLQTLVVILRNGNVTRNARALIDTGSQRSYITKKAVKVLGYQSKETMTLRHTLFGGSVKDVEHKRYKINMESTFGNFKCTMEVLDQEKICGSISRVPAGSWMQEFASAGIRISDVGQDTPDIHILIGADVIGKLYTGKVHPSTHGPVAVETKLGWTVLGKCTESKSNNNSTETVLALHVSSADIQDLWRLDTLGIKEPVETKSEADLLESAMEYFKNTVNLNDEGRYEVGLPWKEGHPEVSDNRECSERRLKGATRKLKDLDMVEAYEQVFEKWENLGVIERVMDENCGKVSYLPHHPVIKPQSTTTPIRPVFDASAKSKGQPSLNDCLVKGPNLIELIPDVLIRFRLKRHGLISDIEKAFLQISVKEADRNFLRFLWWEKNGQLRVYRHRRVVFGVSSSPFLLAATLNHHLDQVDEDQKFWTEQLRKSLYVDNSILSLDSLQDVNIFKELSNAVLKKGKFDLRGWVWNGPEGSDEKEDKRETIPVLGLLWDITSDKLSLDLRISQDMDKVTMRKILSEANKVFDPLGISCPVTLVPKLLLQELWKRKVSWDEDVPEDLATRFKVWMGQLPKLKEIEIPRWLFGRDMSEGRISLHLFTDASQYAYGACVFVRAEFCDGVTLQLVMGKARVASIKKMTIPRLELLACCVGARLLNNVKEQFALPELQVYCWTDSSNALFWIKKHENWGQFVWNRVEEIRKLTPPEQWRHVEGNLNPADIPSRGCTAAQLLGKRWWEGPEWLRLPQEQWPRSDVRYDMETVLAEKRKTVTSYITVECETPWYLRYFSGYRKILRMIVWILRWRNKTTASNAKTKKCVVRPITAEEESKAERALWRMIQEEMFCEEDPVLKKIDAIKDEDGLWRVRTRIIMRENTEDFRYPVLLPYNHKAVEAMVRYHHLRMQHCGVGTLMNMLREKTWILKSRKIVSRVVHSCQRCRRYRVKPVETVGAPLPVNRVRDADVFEVIGVDLGGPLHLKSGEKVWFCVFTCANYRALHLELLMSLSTESFLQGLRRFVARRGRPSVIISDNGTNFEGMSNAMKKLDWKEITETTAVQKIQWIFNPPSAPWWGGFYERIVGLVKVQLRKIIGRASLNYEELQTVMCDVESLINGRPLTYLSDNVNELLPLTPAMFLGDIRKYGVPDLDTIEESGFNKRYQYRQTLKEELRKRFRQEYLGYLVQKKGVKSSRQLKVGEVVLMVCDNKKRLDWPLARVLELIPGRDGVVRTVRLKTSTGEMLRPIQRVCLLEVHEPEKSSSVVTRFGRICNKPTRLGIDD